MLFHELDDKAAQVASDVKNTVAGLVDKHIDPRFKQVKNDESATLSELEKTYGGMIDKSDKFYQDQINASKQWADKQTQLQNQQTDFTIEKIEQQKDQSKKDYTKEQSGAYVDWQKQSNQYGVNAEQMASNGLAGTGFSESSQVSMYNTYQNRVATAREAFIRATLNYDNAIKEARLQNSSALAEIAYNAYQKQLELSLQGFQYKNQLITDQFNKKQEIKQMYHQRWQDVYDQINKEKALAEEKRQFDAAQKQQKEIANAQLAEQKRQFDILHSDSGDGGGGGEITGGSGSSKTTKNSVTGKTRVKTGAESIRDVERKKAEKEAAKDNVDMKSVLALGYGPISAKRAYELVKEGLAETYVKDGKTYFRKSAAYLKQQGLFG